jgi:hypothetical protein
MNTIFTEAEHLVAERARSYGHPADNLDKISSLWGILLGREITPQQVALCMIALKLARETASHKRDNLVDIAGYLHIYCGILGDENI